VKNLPLYRCIGAPQLPRIRRVITEDHQGIVAMRVAIFNQKGGVGKTTTALNLAAAVTRCGESVLLIDLDPQAHLTSIYSEASRNGNESMFAVYQENRPIAELTIHWPKFGRLVPAHAELIKVDSLFGKGPAILQRLNQSLHAMNEDETHLTTLIDCCPFLGVLSLNAIFASDRILIPISTDHMSMRGALQVERTLKALEPVLKRRVERRYVLTRFDRRRKMSFEIKAKLRDRVGAELCETVIAENVSIAEAPALSLDIFSHAPDSRGAQDYMDLKDELREARFL
jgi:chromosome partitioning protein